MIFEWTHNGTGKKFTAHLKRTEKDGQTFRQIIVKADAIKRTQFEEFLKWVEKFFNINVS